MKKIFLMLSVLVLCSSCAALPQRQKWTTTDKVAFGAACGANAYDFYTTKKVLDRDGYIMDPWPDLLYFGDETPSTGMLALSKAAQLGAAWIVLDRVPSSWRQPILFLMTGTWVFYASGNDY